MNILDEYTSNFTRQFDKAPLFTDETQVTEHMKQTYAILRRGMALFALFFPFILLLYGLMFGIEFFGSMSDYYYVPFKRDPLNLRPAVWLLPVGISAYLLYVFPPYPLFDRFIARIYKIARVNRATPEPVPVVNSTNVEAKAVMVSAITLIVIGTAGYLLGLLFLNWSGTLDVLYAQAPMRTLFVGFLCTIGAFLYLYKGSTRLENSLLNLAGAGAVLVAFFPTSEPHCKAGSPKEVLVTEGDITYTIPCPNFELELSSISGFTMEWHGVFAATFFIMGAAAIFFCSHDTLKKNVNQPSEGSRIARFKQHIDFYICKSDQRPYMWFYWSMGLLLVAAPIVAFTAKSIYGPSTTIVDGIAVASDENFWIAHHMYFYETVGMIAFALYWWVKSDEIKRFGFFGRAT